MKKKIKDRHLDIPAEANRDKHVNYVAREEQDTDPANDTREGKLNERDKTENNRQGRMDRGGEDIF